MQVRFDKVLNGHYPSNEEQLLAMDKLLADPAFRQVLGDNTFWRQILIDKYKELINSVAQKHLHICSTIVAKLKDLDNFSEDSSPDTLYCRYAQKQIRTQILNEQDPLARSIITERWIAILGRSYELGNMQALPVIANEFNGGPVGRLKTPVSKHAANFLKAVDELMVAGNHLSPITRLTDLRYDLALPLVSIFIGKLVSAKEKISKNKIDEWKEKYDLFLETMKAFQIKDDKLIVALEVLKGRSTNKKDVTYINDYNLLWNSMVKKIDTNITLLEKLEGGASKKAAQPSLRNKLIAFETRLNELNTKFTALSEHHEKVVTNFSEFLDRVRQKVTVKKGFALLTPEMVDKEEAVKLDEIFANLSYGFVPKGTTAPDSVDSPNFTGIFTSIVFPEASGEFYANSLSRFLSLITEKYELVRTLYSHYGDDILAKSGKDSLSINQRLNDIIRYCASDNILNAKDILVMIAKLLEYLKQDVEGNATHYQKSAENLLKDKRKQKLETLKKEHEECIAKFKKITKERNAASDEVEREKLQTQLNAEKKIKDKFEDKFKKAKTLNVRDLIALLERLKEIYQSIDSILEEIRTQNPEPKITVKIAPTEDSPTSKARFEKETINELRQALKPLILPKSKQKGREDSPHSSGTITPSSAGRQLTLSNIPSLKGSTVVSGATTPVLDRNGSTICLSPQLTNRSDSSLSSSPAPSPVVEPRRRASSNSGRSLLTDSPSLFRFTPQLANLYAEETAPPLTPPLPPIAASDLPTPPPGASPPIRPRTGSLARNIGVRDLSTLRGSTDVINRDENEKKESQPFKLG